MRTCRLGAWRSSAASILTPRGNRPPDKLRRVRELSAQGEFVAMVGEGINGAPVLGGAGVSIAMSRGSALAQAGANLILVGDSLRSLPNAIEFSAVRRPSCAKIYYGPPATILPPCRWARSGWFHPGWRPSACD